MKMSNVEGRMEVTGCPLGAGKCGSLSKLQHGQRWCCMACRKYCPRVTCEAGGRPGVLKHLAHPVAQLSEVATRPVVQHDVVEEQVHVLQYLQDRTASVSLLQDERRPARPWGMALRKDVKTCSNVQYKTAR